MKSELQKRSARACSELGLTIDLDFELELPSGQRVAALARVRNLGAKNGMIIVRSFPDLGSCATELLGSGFGYSVLAEPREGEDFDLGSFAEMFSDWGWSGDDADKPSWCDQSPAKQTVPK